MSLAILIVLAIVLYTLFDIFVAQAGNKIDSNLSAVIFNGLGALIPLVVYGFYKFSKGAKLMATTGSGMFYSVMAGVAIAVFSVLLIKIFEKGGLAYVVPLIYGGTIVLASLTGWLIFKEAVSAMQILGVVIVTVGIAIIVLAKMQPAIL